MSTFRALAGGVFCFLLIAGCSGSSSTDDGVMEREAFIDLLVEVQLIEAVYNQNMIRYDNPRERMARYYKEAFEQRGVTREQFTDTYAWYYTRPLEMMAVYDEVVDLLTQRQMEMMQSIGGSPAL